HARGHWFKPNAAHQIVAPSSSGLGRSPLKAEIAGSNPAGATNFLTIDPFAQKAPITAMRYTPLAQQACIRPSPTGPKLPAREHGAELRYRRIQGDDEQTVAERRGLLVQLGSDAAGMVGSGVQG